MNAAHIVASLTLTTLTTAPHTFRCPTRCYGFCAFELDSAPLASWVLTVFASASSIRRIAQGPIFLAPRLSAALASCSAIPRLCLGSEVGLLVPSTTHNRRHTHTHISELVLG